MRNPLSCIGAAALLSLVAAGNASACSLCIAHAMGGGLFGIGAQQLRPHASLFGVTHLAFSKSNALDEGGREVEHFQQTSLEGLFGVDPQLMARVSLPMVYKRLRAGSDPAESASGLGDATLGATYQLKPNPGMKNLIAFSLDVKVPTGSNNAQDAGVRRDEHLQLGSGSTDAIVGFAVTGETGVVGDLWFGGLRQRFNGTNSHHYHYGDATLYSAGYSHTVGPRSLAVVEFNGRIARRDRTEDGTPDENSGGHLGYAALSWRQSLSAGLGLIATVQQPVVKKLNGTQSERAMVTLSVTRAY